MTNSYTILVRKDREGRWAAKVSGAKRPWNSYFDPMYSLRALLETIAEDLGSEQGET